MYIYIHVLQPILYMVGREYALAVLVVFFGDTLGRCLTVMFSEKQQNMEERKDRGEGGKGRGTL